MSTLSQEVGSTCSQGDGFHPQPSMPSGCRRQMPALYHGRRLGQKCTCTPLPHLPAARHWSEMATGKHHTLTLSQHNGSEGLRCITLMNSHHHHRHWLHHNGNSDRSFPEHGYGCTAPVTVSVRVSFNTCRSLSITCSVSANNILPPGRTRSFTFVQMTWRPLGTGKLFHRH